MTTARLLIQGKFLDKSSNSGAFFQEQVIDKALVSFMKHFHEHCHKDFRPY